MKHSISAKLFFLVIFLACGCTGNSKDTEAERRVPVKAAAAKRGSITAYLDVTGTSQPLQQAKVGSKVEGIIKEILVDQGAAVKKDQVLLRLEPADFTLGVDQSRAALQQAEHDLEQQAQDWKRIAALHSRGVVAKHRYDSMKAAYEISRARVAESRAGLGLARRKYEDSVVRAPFDGVITQKMMHRGEVSSLWAYKWEVFEIMDLSTIKLECDISEKLTARLREGMEARIAFDAFPGETSAGTIAMINPMVEPGQRTFRIKILVPNGQRKLTAGMFARIRIILATRDNVLLISGSDMLERPDGHFVFVVKDGVAEQRKVTIGDREDEAVEITGGLQEGELVVTEGSQRLQTGYKVDIQS